MQKREIAWYKQIDIIHQSSEGKKRKTQKQKNRAEIVKKRFEICLSAWN